MTTQELKSYIDRILGNNIRLLLPSYWWKRAFGAVIDKIEDSSGVRIVGSTSELENLDVPVGSLASVAGDMQSLSECYLVHSMDELENTHFSTLTKVTGIKFSAPVTADFMMVVGGEDCYIMFLAEAAEKSLGAILSEPISGSVETPIGHLVAIITQGEINMDAVAEINHYIAVHDSHYLISQGKDGYNTPALLSQIDKVIKLTGEPDAYLKGQEWTRILKEGDVVGKEVRELYIIGDDAVTGNVSEEYTAEQLAYNKETVDLYKQGKVSLVMNATIKTLNLDISCTPLNYINTDNGTVICYEVNAVIARAMILVNVDNTGNAQLFSDDINSGSITIDSELSDTSENAVQNKVVTEALNAKADKSQIPTKLSQLEKDIEIDSSITVDPELSITSENPVQNKAVSRGLEDLTFAIDDLGGAIANKADKAYVDNAVANGVITVDSELSTLSANAIQNGAVARALNKKADADDWIKEHLLSINTEDDTWTFASDNNFSLDLLDTGSVSKARLKINGKAPLPSRCFVETDNEGVKWYVLRGLSVGFQLFYPKCPSFNITVVKLNRDGILQHFTESISIMPDFDGGNITVSCMEYNENTAELRGSEISLKSIKSLEARLEARLKEMYDNLVEEILDNEEVVAATLNNLNERVSQPKHIVFNLGAEQSVNKEAYDAFFSADGFPSVSVISGDKASFEMHPVNGVSGANGESLTLSVLSVNDGTVSMTRYIVSSNGSISIGQ